VGVEEESVIQNIVELANEAGLEDVNDDDDDCCSPMVRVLAITTFENWQRNASRVNLKPLMQKRKHQ
jgi:hypothetical protein